MLIHIIRQSKTETSPRKKVQMKRNHKVGVLVAFLKDGLIQVGWSVVNTKAGDVFDRNVGESIAIENATNDINVLNSAPTIVRKHLPKFVDRAGRYFKR